MIVLNVLKTQVMAQLMPDDIGEACDRLFQDHAMRIAPGHRGPGVGGTVTQD